MTLVQPLRTRLFLKLPNGDLRPSDLEVDWPTVFDGPGKPAAMKNAPLYQSVARFPGVLPEGGFSNRGWSTLEALIGVLASTKSWCKEFEKSGGRIYGAMADDENVPDLEEPIKLKDFFSL
jgi:hypothetical protein